MVLLAAAGGDAAAEIARATLHDLELDRLDMLVLAGPDEPDLNGQKTTVVNQLEYCLGGANGMHFHLLLLTRVNLVKPKVCAASPSPRPLATGHRGPPRGGGAGDVRVAPPPRELRLRAAA